MRDYTKYSFLLSLMVLAALAGISRIPAFTVEGVKFKRANILSDLVSYGDESLPAAEATLSRDDLDFVREMQDASNYVTEGEGVPEDGEETASVDNQPGQQSWRLGDEGPAPVAAPADSPQVSLENITVIEDFSPDGAVHRFGRLLGSETRTRNVRIAFLGDSFIEGDIITADVREQLQDIYGGQGVGFVPVTSITAEYRPTVKHSFRGWKDHLLANKKNVPEEFSDRFYVSGILSAANADAWTQYETTTYRKHIGEVSTVRFFYSSTAAGDITFKINDTHERTFPADSSGTVQQISISGGGIKKVRVSVPATEGFAGYGVSLEGPAGVAVDNYSIRSSTGLSLFGTSPAVNAAFNRMLGYDLIVLQYGLNIMSAEVTGYGSYGEQFRNLINYIKRCFPGAAVVVMSVGDRSMQSGGEFVTMPAVPAMIREQRAAAEECGVAFWSTYEAMGGYNSMKRYAEWGWAAKDYTHLSFGGGRKIGTEFVKAIEYARLHPYNGEAGSRTDDPLPAAGEPAIAPPGPPAGAPPGGRAEPADWIFGEPEPAPGISVDRPETEAGNEVTAPGENPEEGSEEAAPPEGSAIPATDNMEDDGPATEPAAGNAPGQDETVDENGRAGDGENGTTGEEDSAMGGDRDGQRTRKNRKRNR